MRNFDKAVSALQNAKGIIFDLDGVVLDSEPVHRDVWNAVVQDYTPPMTWEEYETLIGGTDQKSAAFLKSRGEIPLTEAEIVANYMRLLADTLRSGGVPAVAGCAAFVRALDARKKRLAIASASLPENIDLSLISAGVADCFPLRCSGTQVRRSKPAPDIYFKALDMLGLSAEDCVAFEDTDVGIAAAKDAGIFTVAYANPHSGKQTYARADAVIDGYASILRAICE